jgi:hypothetical protein
METSGILSGNNQAKIVRYLALSLLFYGVSASFNAMAITTTGNNFTLVVPGTTSASLVGGTNDVIFSWDGSLNASVDTAVSNASISSDTPFYGSMWIAHDLMMYGEGTYTIYSDCTPGDPGCGLGGSYTFTVGEGQIGGHMLFDWSGNNNIDVVNVWEPSVFGPSPFETGGDNGSNAVRGVIDGSPNTGLEVWDLMSTDANGDGTNGLPMIDGPFPGFYANFNLMTTPVPVPPSMVLFISGLLGLGWKSKISRRSSGPLASQEGSGCSGECGRL